MFNPFSRTSHLTSCKGSKLTFNIIHRVKKRKHLSLSYDASDYTLFPEGVWGGGGGVWKIPYYSQKHNYKQNYQKNPLEVYYE